jgi:hypothetical protein
MFRTTVTHSKLKPTRDRFCSEYASECEKMNAHLASKHTLDQWFE